MCLLSDGRSMEAEAPFGKAIESNRRVLGGSIRTR